MAANKIQINRAPVLTLWAAVVAERLGFNPDEAVSLGKALAGLNAQSKGRRLGIFKPAPKEIRKARERERGEEFWVDLLGGQLPAVNTDQGVRAVVESKPIAPETVERYLESKFGNALPEARKALSLLAPAPRSMALAIQPLSTKRLSNLGVTVNLPAISGVAGTGRAVVQGSSVISMFSSHCLSWSAASCNRAPP